jgi:hypothetical protein
MLRQRLQVTIMNGGVGVLLRIDDPDQHVDQLHQPIDLHPMVEFGGIMIRKIKQHETVECSIQRRIGLQRVPTGYLQPVQQILSRLLAPTARHGMCSGGTAYPDRRQRGARQGIEDRGLPRPGSTC